MARTRLSTAQVFTGDADGISSDEEVRQTVEDHIQSSDPHAQYLMPVEADLLYSLVGHTHVQAPTGRVHIARPCPQISSDELFPLSNSLPLITHGKEIIKLALPGSVATNKLVATGCIPVEGASQKQIVLALFKDSLCVGIDSLKFNGAGDIRMFSFCFVCPNIGTNSVYSIRMGVTSKCTWYANKRAFTAGGAFQTNGFLFTELAGE